MLWLLYIFGVITIAAQLYVLQVAFYKEMTVKSKFYGFPVANVGVIYLLAQLVLGLVFMALAKVVPLWLPLVVYVVLLGAAAVGLFIAADAMRDEVERAVTDGETDAALILCKRMTAVLVERNRLCKLNK